MASADEVVETVFYHQKRRIVPGEPKGMVRDSPAITLLSRRAVAGALDRGTTNDYDLGRLRALLTKHEDCVRRDSVLTVKRGDVRVYGRRLVYAAIESDTLAGEVAALQESLAVAGLRGITRGKPQELHLTFVNAGKGNTFSRDEQDAMIGTLEAALPVEFDVDIWDPYPFDILNPADQCPSR